MQSGLIAPVIPHLNSGMPLGINSVIPVCKVLLPPDAPDIPLQHCDSAWQSAIDHADVVDELLQTELREGWIRLVPGGDEELRRTYPHSAVGKLGVVLAEGRPPRLGYLSHRAPKQSA